MINALEVRTKTNETIANMKEQAVKYLMPKVNDVIESAIERGNKRVRIIINDEMNEEQKQREEQSLISFIEYNSNEHVIDAVVEELKRCGYAARPEVRRMFRLGSDYMAVDISWAEDNAES
ncbi:hypothetical protein [Weissella minor]|uniref:hypothetical protein n=1 Tax=Weissella minor TaxID=1620 RepID=UPI001BB02A24|nr:hypothetical protein [Weissella minor]